MKRNLQTALAAAAVLAAGHAAAQVTIYGREGFRGESIQIDERVGNLQRFGFNDRASSIVVERGRWEVCEHARFEGRCYVLRRGSYPSLRDVGINNQISSIRPLDNGRRSRYSEIAPPQVAVVPAQPAYAPPPPVAAVPVPPPQAQWRRRPQEVVEQVPVTSVRAVMGPPDQRCWVERQPVQSNANVGGAIVGGLVGGILGHQVGGGSGRDIATGVGTVAGAVIGSNVANGNAVASTRDVQRCEAVPNQAPAYYDVTYNWRGMEHHVQMTSPPGRTLVVNGNGEPRL